MTRVRLSTTAAFERGDLIQTGDGVHLAVLDVGHFVIEVRRATWLDHLRAWARGMWRRFVSAVRR